ncbi:MAG: glycosyltransferase family 2 protein [Bacillaceae bacterium]|nr:glycosyltransferase family 2 protein [Bacillaceae bacterium]
MLVFIFVEEDNLNAKNKKNELVELGHEVYILNYNELNNVQNIVNRTSESFILILKSGVKPTNNYINKLKESNLEENVWVVLKFNEKVIGFFTRKERFNEYTWPVFIPFKNFILDEMAMNPKIQKKTVHHLNKVSVEFGEHSLRWMLEKEKKWIKPIIENRYKEKEKRELLFSIVICTYNNAKMLDWAIYSVMAQQYENWELIIVDDGSIDETKQLLKSYSKHPYTKIISHSKNNGKAYCLNEALHMAEGSWFLELDSDDWLPIYCTKRLEEAALKIKKEDRVALLFGDYVEWTERSRDGNLFYSKQIQTEELFNSTLYIENPRPIVPRAFHIPSIKSIGGWITNDISNGRMYEDVSMLYNLSNRYSLKKLNDFLYHRRLRMNSITHHSPISYTEWKKWLTRQKK